MPRVSWSRWYAPGFVESVGWNLCFCVCYEEAGMPRRYPAEFRARSVALIRAGRSVREVALLVGVSEQALYGWRRQDRIDRGEVSGVSRVEFAELVAARRRIRELEVELAIHRRAVELLKGVVPPKSVLRR